MVGGCPERSTGGAGESSFSRLPNQPFFFTMVTMMDITAITTMVMSESISHVRDGLRA
jgi:hypothetical protein